MKSIIGWYCQNCGELLNTSKTSLPYAPVTFGAKEEENNVGSIACAKCGHNYFFCMVKLTEKIKEGSD